MTNGAVSTEGADRRSRRWLLWLPVIAFGGLAVALAVALNRDPRTIPSALIGRAVPVFDLPPVSGRALGLSSRDLTARVALVNVFASWCAACREEHPVLMQIKAQGLIPIYGLDYKDSPTDVAAWLDALGDPYDRTGADREGRVAIDWGVYGVPETYVVDRAGRIVHKHIGALTMRDLQHEILPLIERLRQ